MFALLILSLYWDIGSSTDAQGMQSTASLLYFVMALCGYGAAAVVPSLTLERPLFIREGGRLTAVGVGQFGRFFNVLDEVVDLRYRTSTTPTRDAVLSG